MNSTWNTSSVDRFVKLVKTARDYNSKDVKLSIGDAEDLAISLASMLNSERELTQRIMRLQDQLLKSNSDNTVTNSGVQFDGGQF
jgi:major membrane immunogen (membrane-anchored lipoprotein)